VVTFLHGALDLETVFQSFQELFMNQTKAQATPTGETAQHRYLDANESARLVRLSINTFRVKTKSGDLPAGRKVSPRKTLWIESELIAAIGA